MYNHSTLCRGLLCRMYNISYNGTFPPTYPLVLKLSLTSIITHFYLFDVDYFHIVLLVCEIFRCRLLIIKLDVRYFWGITGWPLFLFVCIILLQNGFEPYFTMFNFKTHAVFIKLYRSDIIQSTPRTKE